MGVLGQALSLGAKALLPLSGAGLLAQQGFSLQQYRKDRFNQLKKEGRDPVTGEYNFQLFDRPLLGEEFLDPSRDKMLGREFAKSDIPSLIKADPTLPKRGKNQTVQEYESANPQRLRTARLAQKARGEVEVRGIVNKAVEQSPEFQRNEARYEDEIAYRNNLLLQNRLDQQDRYAQELKLLGMQQDADQARYNQNLELYREDQKQGQINNLVAGLVALSAAFAV